MDRGAWWATVHGVAKSRTRLSDFMFTLRISLSLLQWIFLTQESNWGLLHCRQILYQLSYQGSTKNTGLGCHALLQGIFPTQRSNLGLLHCRQILYHLCYQGIWKHLLGELKFSSPMAQRDILSPSGCPIHVQGSPEWSKVHCVITQSFLKGVVKAMWTGGTCFTYERLNLRQ